MGDSIDKIARDVCEAVCEYRKQVGFDCSSMGCSGCRFEVSTMSAEITRRIDDITSKFFMPYPMGKDGELIKPGDTCYGEDGKAWAINAVGPVYCYGVDAKKPGISKRLRHEWLTKDAPDSWEFEAEYDEEYECSHCGKPFFLEKRVEVTYTSMRRIEDMPEGWEGE